ncbi:MAG: hypothetical protein ABSD85_10305 [Acidimicrobiales bacterium]|jgi:hypothetical protein
MTGPGGIYDRAQHARSGQAVNGDDESERTSTGLPPMARFVLRSYPAWWRERYGEDQEMFLRDLSLDGRPLRRAIFDLAIGAARVRLRPTGMPQSVAAWRDRTRASIAWATVPALVGLDLADVILDHSFRNSAWAAPSSAMTTDGRVAADALSAVSLAGVALLLFLLVGWALVGRLADRAPRGRAGTRWLLLVVAPLMGGVVEIVLSVLRALVTPGVVSVIGIDRVVRGGHPLLASVLSVAWDVVGVMWLLSIFCVVVAARRAEVQVSDLRAGVWLAQLTALVLFIVTLAALAWGIGVSHQPPMPRADLIGSGPGVRPWTGIQTSILAEWPLVVAGLAVVSFVTGRAALTARRSYRTARGLVRLGA